MRRAGLLALGLVLVPASTALAQEPGATFYRDVAPILQERCQSCHRAGEIGPMPLGTYTEVRPFAKAITNAVVTRKMPPWFAEASVGRFHNDPSLSQREIDTLVRWTEGGAVAGDPKDAPPPRVFADGWNIGTPDVVLEMPHAYEVPPRGTIEYTYVILPTGFKEDTWITGAEVRPGNRAVMHHATIFVRPQESSWLRKYPVGQPFVPAEQIRNETTPTPAATTNAGAGELDLPIVGYVPGRPARRLSPGYGILIPAGADLIFQLHYTANGTIAPDKSRVGFVLAKERPAMQVLRLAAANDRFVIPAGADNYVVSGALALNVDAELIEAYPHMHLRGKSMKLVGDLPQRRARGSPERAPLRFQLAAHLRDGRAQARAERHGSHSRWHLQQLGEQSLQPRCVERGQVGRSELGRDDGGILPGRRAGGHRSAHCHEAPIASYVVESLVVPPRELPTTRNCITAEVSRATTNDQRPTTN